MFGINVGLIAMGVGFWILGRRLETFSKLPHNAKPWVPAFVAAWGSFVFSLSEPAMWLANILGWFFGLFSGGNYILGMLTIVLLILLIFGLFDGSLDKRDITAMALLPIFTLSLGGAIGNGANTIRSTAGDAAMSLVTTLVG